MEEILNKVIWGNTLENWGISIIIIIIAVIVTKVVSLFNKKVLKSFTRRTKNHLDDIVYDAVESPILFAIMLLGIWIAIHRLVYPDNFVKAVDSSYKILIVLNITWLFTRLISSIIQVYWINRSDDAQPAHRQISKMMPIIKRTVLVLIWIIGIVMALSNVGVNISALLGTLGIGGIAFALAAQDTVKNIFGAFTLLTDRPFNIGDTIKIDTFEGTITDIGVRSTTMMDYDNRLITFPNYKVADSYIINISAEPKRRVVMDIALSYNTTPDKMKEAMNILKGIPSRVQNVSKDGIITNFSRYTDSAFIMNFIYFIEKEGDIGLVTSNVNMDILSSFNSAELHFAYPSRSIYIEKNVLNEDIKDEKLDNKPTDNTAIPQSSGSSE